MALRFLEVRLPRDVHGEAEGMSEGHEIIDQWCTPADDEELHQYLLESQNVEPLVDALRSRFGDVRIIVMPVEATIPRELPPNPDPVLPSDPEPTPKAKDRISREELYEDINDGITLTPAFIAFAGLAAVVASVGLIRDDLVAIIGAMVIAPLLGPNMALALGTTLADFDLLKRSLKSNMVGVGLSFGVAFAIGAFVTVDPSSPEIAARTGPDLGHMVLALASGIAGALAFTTGAPAGLVGVMVAVALLPPLATAALLLAHGHVQDALGAFLLLGTNLVAVNLAAVATFVVQGIRPLWSKEKEAARKAARNAIILWTALAIAFAYVLVRVPREL